MNEYLYGETLRWSFGFENPNKAAVVFACLLPLCWWAWTASWGIRRTWLRIPSLAFSAGVFLATGGCLVMTFSRGGLVAGVAALGYVWALTLWKSIRWHENGSGGTSGFARIAEASADGAAPSRHGVLLCLKCWLSLFLIVLLICLAVWSGLASRSVEGLAEDASVTNRFDLWKAGVQMACENPAGFWSGQSGTEFMQWYQATDRTEGYRTMVNSYLTFLVEQGWRVFALSVFG
ncbi:MAG: O-antigen ligase family protein, partial [Terrimicrobiaceae bacterium]